MRKLLGLILGLSLLVGCNQYTPIDTGNLVEEHNAVRVDHNLNFLTVNEKLNDAAQKHAEYMAKKDKLSHYGKGGSRPSKRITNEGYKYYMVGENIAAGYNNVSGVMVGWMDSPGHKKNVLGKYHHIGTGTARSKSGRLYWCVLFAVPSA